MKNLLPVFAAAVFLVLLTSLGIHWLELELAISLVSEVIIALPAIWAVLTLVAGSALLFRCTGYRLLTPQQLLLAAFAASLAAPMLSQGFWHRMFGAVTTMPREGQLAAMTVLSDRLWPHGPDLAAGWIVSPLTVDAEHPHHWTITGLTNNEPVLATALVRATELPTGTNLRFWLMSDDHAVEVDIANLNRPARPDPLRTDGAESIGAYGVKTPTSASGTWRLALAVTGPGSVTVDQVRLRSVAAIETALSGARSTDQTLTAAQQVVPWSAWRDPLIAWGGFLGLLFTATYAVNAVMRKQWVDAERFSLPVARVWSMMVGAQSESGTTANPQQTVWQSGWLWGAAAVTCGWGLLRWAHIINPGIPSTSIDFSLSTYFSDPAWGGMWNISFSLSALILGIALFFEVGLLGSMLIGFALYRSLFWQGERFGLSNDHLYPWRFEQQVGAFVAYGLIILVSARRHLLSLAGQVLHGGWKPDQHEALSARTAAALLVACAGGTVWWAWWTNIGLLGTSSLMAFLLLVSVVSSRLRAESGLLFSLFAPYSAATVLLALGGIGTFGANAILLAFIASFFLAANTFFIPGAQLELIEIAKRERLPAWSTAILTAIGIGGGFLIGGWVFLTTIYGLGSDHLPFQWAFDPKMWYFGKYQSAVVMAGAGEHGQVSWAGYLIGLIATSVAAATRLVWSGFAVHPAGILFGPSYMMEMFWGSTLVAFVLRWAAVRAGGAEVVRTRLLPLAIGLILGSAVAYLVMAIHTALLLKAGLVAPSIGNAIL